MTLKVRRTSKLVLFLAPGLMGLLVACVQHRNVTATCTNIERYHSNLGTVNVPLYGLGKVLLLSTAGSEKRVYGVAALALLDTDKSTGAQAAELSIQVDASFQLTFDASVPAAVKAQLETSLSNGTNVVLKNTGRVDLADAVALVDKNSSLKAQMKASAADTSKRFVVVSSVKTADDLELKLSSSAKGRVEAQVLRFGDYKLNVTYQCAGLARFKGNTATTSVFYGVTPVKYDEMSNAIVLDDAPLNAWEFDHSSALTE